jgi:hypothetical protein
VKYSREDGRVRHTIPIIAALVLTSLARRLWRVAQVVTDLIWQTDFLISHGETRVGSSPTPLKFFGLSSLFAFDIIGYMKLTSQALAE